MIQTPNILIIDLKTSGLYLKSEPIDSKQQPWAPYISALQCDATGRVVNMFSTYIKSDGRAVRNGALEKHGIDHRMVARIGIPESRALGVISDMLKVAPFEDAMRVVTFGDMDKMVLASLFARFAITAGKPSNAFDKLWFTRPLTEFVDLQKPYAQRLCKLVSEHEDGDFRWPTLEEACKTALGRSAARENDCLEDVLLLKDLYFNFAARGYFETKEVA